MDQLGSPPLPPRLPVYSSTTGACSSADVEVGFEGAPGRYPAAGVCSQGCGQICGWCSSREKRQHAGVDVPTVTHTWTANVQMAQEHS
eukprot:352312-Chlamydomonas_euryale.AAC.13